MGACGTPTAAAEFCGAVQRNPSRLEIDLLRPGLGDLGESIATNYHPKYAAALRRILSSSFTDSDRSLVQYFRRGGFRDDHSHWICHGPNRKKMVHRTEHGTSGVGI